MSFLRVNSITGKDDNSTVNHPITLSSNTVNLNSGVVFPDGHVTNFISKMYEFTSSVKTYANDSGGQRIAVRESASSAVVPNFTAKQGHTYRIEFRFPAIVERLSGSNSGRAAIFKMYYDTTSRSQGDSTIGGTMIGFDRGGRNMTSAASSGSQGSYIGVYLNGTFYHSGSDATVYVYYTTEPNSESTDFVVYSYQRDIMPANLMITEFQGNCSTVLSG